MTLCGVHDNMHVHATTVTHTCLPTIPPPPHLNLLCIPWLSNTMKQSTVIFLYFSRAFDTISHKMLLTKLQYYGIRGTALCLFESYLAGREQYVCQKQIEHQHWNSPKGQYWEHYYFYFM